LRLCRTEIAGGLGQVRVQIPESGQYDHHHHRKIEGDMAEHDGHKA
jgi:hypothetical protein